MREDHNLQIFDKTIFLKYRTRQIKAIGKQKSELLILIATAA